MAVALSYCSQVSIRRFYPPKEERPAAPKRLFYYARPGTPRNGFELAAAALTRLKPRQGDRVEIICAGTGWNPEQYGLGGMVTSVGMLPYAATGLAPCTSFS